MAVEKKKIAGLAKKLYLKEVLAILFILSAVYFFRQQRGELKSIIPAIKNAHPLWIALGAGITLLYILLQSGMYVFAFGALRAKMPWLLSIELFLKRNLLSIFLPAGGISSLAYMPGSLKKSNIKKQDVYNASAIYGFIGFVSIILVGVPVILYAALNNKFNANALQGIVYLSLFLILLLWLGYAIRTRGKFYDYIINKFPSLQNGFKKFAEINYTKRGILNTTLASVGVELCGIFHIYIAMLALGLPFSLQAACVGYIVSVVLLFTSPFLRGLGAVELSLVYILTRYGYTATQALEITILYRIFEFWLPLVFGILSYAAKGRKIFLRLVPAVLIFILGIINILSAITPPIRHRIFLLKQYIDTDVMHASTLLTLFVGLLLIITATYLVKGLKTAWVIAVAFAALSLIMNLTKALDWEEASFALFTLIVLITTYRQYRLKSNKAALHSGIINSIIVFALVVIFETLGFYFLQVRHFQQDFTWMASFRHAIQTFLFISNDNLQPVTKFGKDFIISVHTLSAGTLVYLVFNIFRASAYRPVQNENDVALATTIAGEYGNAAVDYFKLAKDKKFFFADDNEGFISYAIANGYAIALDEPVCAEEEKIPLLKSFGKECRKRGLKLAFYRVDEDSLYYFEELKLKKLFIGQEAVVDTDAFTLEGRDKKSLRNGLSGLAKKGFTTKIFTPPLADEVVEKIKKISDEWLITFDKKESIFSQGMFDAQEIKQQTVFVLEDSEQNLVAFLNVIPDYTPGGFTYDMIRKTAEAPGASMDALIIELIKWGKAQGYKTLNMGLVPLSGIQTPVNPAERVVKFAYEKVKRFQHYQGLRDFKGKYASRWLNKYLIYENDFDLVELPGALNKVMITLVENDIMKQDIND